jgi:hypothetical protein
MCLGRVPHHHVVTPPRQEITVKTTTHTSRRRRRVALGITLLAAAATGCGNDSDDASLSESACDAYAAIGAAMFGDPSGVADARDALVAGVDDELADAATVYGDAMVAALNGDETALDGEPVTTAAAEIGAAATATCESDAALDVGGIDFAYEGLPGQLPEGRIAIDFTNDTTSAEPHEMVLLRRADGVEESVAELLDLPEEELFSKVTPTAVVFADTRGDEGHALVDLPAGNYIAICMIPTGGDGPPHAVEGMVDEFTVS